MRGFGAAVFFQEQNLLFSMLCKLTELGNGVSHFVQGLGPVNFRINPSYKVDLGAPPAASYYLAKNGNNLLPAWNTKKARIRRGPSVQV
ncbi:hypothetical protein C2I18_24760 [Paenibacillus sp. PK3_47]|nr:hypothetical protein C2I18_24760 [Paenibacillus sp. PK3_47]